MLLDREIYFTFSPYVESLLKWIWEHTAVNQVLQGKESANMNWKECEKYITIHAKMEPCLFF